MGFGQSKIPPDLRVNHYLHKEKIDGSLATQKEEERLKMIEEMRKKRRLEQLEKQKQLDAVPKIPAKPFLCKQFHKVR